MNTTGNVQRAIDFLEDHILDALSVKTIAGQAHMSGFHFQRMFRIMCGMTIRDYISNRRLSLAGGEVISTPTKIADIAIKYGYQTDESFSRAFTDFHRVSPMAARDLGQVNTFARLTIKSVLEGSMTTEKLRERGYLVKENGTVYYEKNMDKTIKWFEYVLGWCGATRNGPGWNM